MPDIRTSHEQRRGCGFRKPGGLYLFMEATSFSPCGWLPQPSEPCDCCGLQLTPVRTMAMRPCKAIFPKLEERPCNRMQPDYEGSTPCCGLHGMAQSSDQFLLDWVGKSFYPTTQHFIKEAQVQGISRRIQGVPEGFVLGETTIILGHAAAYDSGPGYFAAYSPERIEYIVKGDETEEELQEMTDQGFELVRVYEMHDQQASMFEFPEVNTSDALQRHTLDSLRNTLSELHQDVYDKVEIILNDHFGRGVTRGLAKKIYGYLTADLGRPTDMANLFKQYAELRVEEYKKELKI